MKLNATYCSPATLPECVFRDEEFSGLPACLWRLAELSTTIPNELELRHFRSPSVRRGKRKLAAFTLIEIIISVAISAIVLACLGTLFFGAMRLRDTATIAAEQATPVDHAIGIMKRDLLAIVPIGKLAGVMGSDAVPQSSSPQPLLEIYSASGNLGEDEPWGDVQKIDYWLQAPSNRNAFAGQDLIRGVTRNLLSSNTILSEAHAVLQGVQTLAFSYYDGTNWNDTWSTTLSNIPVAIKVSIDFAADKKLPQVQPPVKFYVPVVSWASTNSITNQISGN